MPRRPKTYDRGGVNSRLRAPLPQFDDLDDEAAFWEAEGRRCALDAMDLPDGAYFAMAEELGLDPL